MADPLTPSTVKVPALDAGDTLLTFETSEGHHAQAVAIVDNEGVQVGAEDNGLHVTSLDFAHYELHEGDAYVAVYLVSSLGSGSSHDHLLVTPDTDKWAHHVLEVISTAEAEVYVYEGADSTGGTAVPAYNRNRNSANTAAVTVAHTPSVTTAGTQIWVGMVWSGNRAGGGQHDLSEIILKQNTKYLFRFTSRAAGNKLLIRHNWYEHTFGD